MPTSMHPDATHEVPTQRAPSSKAAAQRLGEEQFGPSMAIFLDASRTRLRLAIAHHLMHRPHSRERTAHHLGHFAAARLRTILRILREAHVIDREQQGSTTIYRLGKTILATL